MFSDYIKRQQSRGGLLISALPSPVYLYGASINHSFTINTDPTNSTTTTLKLRRVGPLNKGIRNLVWGVTNNDSSSQGKEVECVIEVKDKSEKFVFEGPMADVKVAGQV